uniref:Uncharacterized protein n=1 Tax=Mycobacterium kansasii TaxID=1768 RepID=A0A653F736_MYCKA|nr:hypothetical protein BIN_B_04656 [Mycobacterium kansasii]
MHTTNAFIAESPRTYLVAVRIAFIAAAPPMKLTTTREIARDRPSSLTTATSTPGATNPVLVPHTNSPISSAP